MNTQIDLEVLVGVAAIVLVVIFAVITIVAGIQCAEHGYPGMFLMPEGFTCHRLVLGTDDFALLRDLNGG
jgi:hypothetical protein